MKRKFTFTSDTCHLAEMRHHARAFLADCGVEECAAELLILAVDEACTNIIRYAYEHDHRPIRLYMERLSDRIRFILRDYGKTCDPSKIHSRALEDVRPGGVGVHIIKQAFDHVSYDPQPRGTRLILEKLFSEEPSALTSGS